MSIPLEALTSQLTGRGLTPEDIQAALDRAPGPRPTAAPPLTSSDPAGAAQAAVASAPTVAARATLPDPRQGMNRGEARFADELDRLLKSGAIARWDFEPENLRLAGHTFYRPDFRVLLADGTIVFVDVKGAKGDGYFVKEDAWLKMKAIAARHPYQFLIVWPKRKGKGWNEKVVGEGRGTGGRKVLAIETEG